MRLLEKRTEITYLSTAQACENASKCSAITKCKLFKKIIFSADVDPFCCSNLMNNCRNFTNASRKWKIIWMFRADCVAEICENCHTISLHFRKRTNLSLFISFFQFTPQWPGAGSCAGGTTAPPRSARHPSQTPCVQGSTQVGRLVSRQIGQSARRKNLGCK